MLRTYPVNFDLLVAIPPHVSPKVVLESGLSDNNSSAGWIQVDPKTMQTKHYNVFAIGDVAAIHGTFFVY
jgi:sulfide:quinone oxidoreductase